MEHSHTCGCGCHGHEHEHHHHQHGHSPVNREDVTPNQVEFLHQLFHCKALPVARFVVVSSREEEFQSVALAPVFLRSAGDDIDAVKEAGVFLRKLEDMGLLTLDYDIPLSGYDYPEYETSALYAYFAETVHQGAREHPDFLGDTPRMELGSMALTPEGEALFPR